MAMELQHIIHRVVRKQLFPQLVQEEALLAGNATVVDGPFSFSSTSSSAAVFSSTFPLGPRSSVQHTTPSLLLHPLNNSHNANNLSSTSFLSLNNRPDAKERRRLVQRTRVLKNDITKFETEFKTNHGYEPKSVHDRQNMNNVYEELRKLKLIIRDNAALHIQSIYRGYKARKAYRTLKQTKTPSLPGNSTDTAAKTQLNGNGTNTALSEAMLKLSQLRDEKATLKRQLRQFDIDFANTHQGRVPTKAEKEHLRPAYTRYHALKNLIAEAEVAAGVTSTSSGRGDSPPPPPLPSSSSSSLNSSTATPKVNGTVTAKPTIATNSSNSSFSSVNTGNTPGTSVSSANNDNTRLRSDSGASGIGLDADDDFDALLNTPNPSNDTNDIRTNSSTSTMTSEQILALRTEKKKLQAQLREYEKEFLNRNGRSVKYVKDINPVMAKYTRYKALKAQLKELGIQ